MECGVRWWGCSAVAKNRVEIRDMIIEILQGEQVQWCTLEFQGEVLAEENETLDGYELGNCVVDGVHDLFAAFNWWILRRF